MSKRRMVQLIALLCAAVFMCTASPAMAKKVLLKVPVCFATALPGLGTTAPWLADRIETLSNGQIGMKVYEPGKLVAPFEILDSVSKGKINAGYATAAYWQGKIPAAPLFSAVPFPLDSFQQTKGSWKTDPGPCNTSGSNRLKGTA